LKPFSGRQLSSGVYDFGEWKMATDLDRLLASIDPVKTLDKIARDTDDAMNAYRVLKGSVENRDELETVMADFYCHLENKVNRLHPPRTPNIDTDWARCRHFLIEQYGPNWDKTAFLIAHTGLDGGLYAVMKAVAQRQAEEWAKNLIEFRISEYWNKLSIAEMHDSISEYLEKFGHLLPSDMMEKSAIRFRANPLGVLKEHPYLMQRLRRAARR
jgi:hypothetical protein